ncbi:MAG: hypothetical protein NXI23_12010 [Bacteroidetes bacterium]|nr:hypothetical protein [Bacteroidota bacterium]MDF1866235.1 hypothetical protein [Saprospiraceae bacterium]
MSKIAHFLTWIVAFIGLNSVFSLAKEEATIGNICPQLLGIPSCYIILGCLVMILISQAGWLKDRLWLFIIGAGIGSSIAIFGSVGHFLGWLDCPKTHGGTPICYLLLALFSTLIFLKYLERKG